jgi:hypothetical protein
MMRERNETGNLFAHSLEIHWSFVVIVGPESCFWNVLTSGWVLLAGGEEKG